MARKDVEETVSGMHRMIRSIEARAAVEDPWVMAEMVKMQSELDNATVRVVAQLREAGYTWSDIGFALGTTRQGAFNRFNHRIGKRERGV